MSDLALQLIAENKKTKDPYLDLGNCGLTELPPELLDCVWLETLILSNEWFEFNIEKQDWHRQISKNKGPVNKIGTLPPNLSSLNLLKKLNTGGSNSDKWPLFDLSPIAHLNNLQYLDIHYTQISDLNPIDKLSKLQSLSVYNTQVNDLSPIALLNKLHSLDVASTQINDLGPISRLSNLQYLDIHATKVSNLIPISTLGKLHSLNVMHTQINNLEPIAPLSKLRSLRVSGTQVNDLRPIAFLSKLQLLEVYKTKVSDLRPIALLNKLQLLDISQTRISDLRPILPLIKKGRQVRWSIFSGDIRVADCPLISPPPEVVQQGNEAILNYFAQIESQGGTEEILEAKMLIVGEGKTGKTTLFKKMENPAFDPVANPTDETHGINIHEGLPIRHSSLGEKVFYANMWDFGGQELQYMTHQFFLTPRALYVLMMDARTEAPNLPYWFKIISLLGKDRENSNEKVPVLLVFNKRKDGTGKTPPYQDTLKYYEEHLDPYFIELISQ
ncbi:MAG: hypothetical protein R2791_05640 [Saprospiraceae bacterium]